MLATHSDAELRYESYRQMVREHVKEAIPYGDASQIHLSGLDSRAINQAKLWDTIPERRTNFDWETDTRIYRKMYPKRFELAIWYQNRLESLSLGRPSFKGTRLRLELIERVAGYSMLKGRSFAITELALIAYANLLGADEIRIMQPINAAVRDFYVQKGYSYVPSTGARHFPDYCVKKI
ncbi:hypothetical protein ACJJI5_05025 [Microbulbifer sp. EKSA008]|uniref:hypothetical protein n=1 Tax=Microbulbifer sp. EKSA008 TaxID=3243367 RepID=UPI0040437AF9